MRSGLAAAAVAVAVAFVVLGVLAPRVTAQAPVSLQLLLPRCAAYVRQFERDLGSVVSEELYTQDIRPSAGLGQRQGGGRIDSRSCSCPIRAAPSTRRARS
jgi:hypothetical protein